MKTDDHINEEDLNELLKSLSLDDKTGTTDETARFVMSQEYDAKPDPAREEQLIHDLHQQFGKSPKQYWYLSGAILVMGLIGLYYYLYQSRSQDSMDQQAPLIVEQTSPTVTEKIPEQDSTRQSPVVNYPVLKDVFGHDVPQVAMSVKDSVKTETNVQVPVAVKRSQAPHIPVLSAEEKRRYSRVKRMMLDKLVSMDKTVYTAVPADKMEYAGKTEILEPFTIRNFSISNLEYKAFLADLLVQNRTEDYLKAQVQAGNWIAYGAPGLSNTYLQEERYNDFPVVNVSLEGARLFCSWLQAEAKQYMQEKNRKPKDLQLRLPTEKEWAYIAWAGYSKIPYESNSYCTVFDKSEGLVAGDFEKRIRQIQKHARQKDTLYDLLMVNKYGWSETEINAFMNKAFSYYKPEPADTIYPARMKAYMKVGSVSEMTLASKPGQIWLSGKLWKNKEEYTRMKEAFIQQNASPFVGFRIVVINSSDSEYKDPFW